MDSSDSDTSGSDSNGNAFITILSTGAYRVKGTVNEMNIQNIVEGEPVVVRSRVDSNQTWKGTMGNIDKDAASTSNNSDTNSMMDSSGDSQTSSSTYPFYVNLDSSDGLMLGQHVYIEPDEGQDEQKAGLWLSEVYIVDADTDSPYVWARNDKKKLEKRSVILGQYDENMGEYEIADGLSKSDYIAYPSDSLKEGMSTTTNSDEATDPETLDMESDSSSDMSSDGTDDDMAAYQDNVDETYENDSDGTVIDDDTKEDWRRRRNTLANLQLLEGRENESKNATPLVDWLKVTENSENAKYLPSDVSYELSNFEEFMEKRQELMSKALKDILL